MNTSTLTRKATKPHRYFESPNLFYSLPPSTIVKKNAEQFSSALAHEIRNPLATIKLAVEMLQSSILDIGQKKYLDIIMRSSARINDLIIELLKCSQADEVQTENHSICQLLDEVIEMAKDRIVLKNISVSKAYAAKDCKIVLNGQKMKIALTNIIINAIDAMSAENGELKLGTRLIGDRYAIEIADNGCRISGEDLKYIFKPSYSNKPGGLGHGLATTYEILRLNHVRVNVESQIGEGTRFILLFEKKYQHSLPNY
ncbi:MAG: ATP-binding protein [Chitinophagaceae bacterium]